MSWIERSVEERLELAARKGELAAPRLEGKPLADLDRQRPQGWWADQFVTRELSHDRRKVAAAAAAKARTGFWKATDVAELRDLLGRANAEIRRANVNLIADDQLAEFDLADIESRWRALC